MRAYGIYARSCWRTSERSEGVSFLIQNWRQVRKYRPWSTFHVVICLFYTYKDFYPSWTRFSPFSIRENKCQVMFLFRLSVSSKTWCKYSPYKMFTSSTVNASVAFDLFSFPCFFCKSFAWSFQTFPCLVKLFVVDNPHGIFAFFKTFLARVFAESFCSAVPGGTF